MTDYMENVNEDDFARKPDDRIRLAEAMFPDGLVIGREHSDGTRNIWQVDENGKCILNSIRPLPDPQHDANDDHAVLEWMRETYRGDKILDDYLGALPDHPIWYRVGDYARAALKVIDDE